MTNRHIDSPHGDDGEAATKAVHADVGAENGAGAESQLGQYDDLSTGTALLVVIRGPNTGSQFRLDQPITTAGRHASSDIFLDDITASRRHAEFHTKHGDFSVVDMGSLNGTYVNGHPVHCAVLADDDQIQIGKFRLMFRSRG